VAVNLNLYHAKKREYLEYPTGNGQRRFAADNTAAGERVGRFAVVHADIGAARDVVRLYDAQKEELPGRQQHPVRQWIVVGGGDRLSVAVPADDRRRLAFRFTVERRRFVPRYDHVVRVFHDARDARRVRQRTWSNQFSSDQHSAASIYLKLSARLQ